jgi:hypothetical protein
MTTFPFSTFETTQPEMEVPEERIFFRTIEGSDRSNHRTNLLRSSHYQITKSEKCQVTSNTGSVDSWYTLSTEALNAESRG